MKSTTPEVSTDRHATAPEALVSTRIYVSFDIHHDRVLYERLVDQSGPAGFTVTSGSEDPFAADFWDARLRSRIGAADQMIVICGEHSDASKCMSDELRIAREEGTPYFLLWGRREVMCTKPIGAKSDEGMYNWTPTILRDQIAIALRSRSRALQISRDAARLRRPTTRDEGSSPV
jgi:hypothetical protein